MPTPHFSVKNFAEFQHYKDRNPVWIKFYNSSLDDYNIGLLPDASKAHLYAIWLLASRYHNAIPYDAEWIGRRINATEPVNLELLTEHGFIILDQDCSNALATCYQDASPEKRREEKNREEREKNIRARGTRLPDNWKPSPECIQYAIEKGMDNERAHRASEDFRDYWHTSTKNAVKRNWDTAWKLWVRRAIDYGEAKPNGNGGGKRFEPSSVVGAAKSLIADIDRKRAVNGGGGVSGNGADIGDDSGFITGPNRSFESDS